MAEKKGSPLCLPQQVVVKEQVGLVNGQCTLYLTLEKNDATPVLSLIVLAPRH